MAHSHSPGVPVPTSLEQYLAACLQAWGDKRKESVVAALMADVPRVAVDDALTRYLTTLEGKSRDYFVSMRSLLRRVFAGLGITTVDALTPEAVRKYLDSETRAKTPPKTVKHLRWAVKAFGTWALRERMIGADPVGDYRAPTTAHDPDALTPDQVGTVLTAAKGHPGEVAVCLSLLAGLRRCEIARLTWSHVDLSATPPTITLPRAVVKGNTKPRKVRVSVLLLPILQRAKIAKVAAPAGGAHEDTLSGWAAEILDIAKVRHDGPRRALQVLRRTWVSVLRFRGADPTQVADAAGHSLAVQERDYRRRYDAPTLPEMDIATG